MNKEFEKSSFSGFQFVDFVITKKHAEANASYICESFPAQLQFQDRDDSNWQLFWLISRVTPEMTFKPPDNSEILVFSQPCNETVELEFLRWPCFLMGNRDLVVCCLMFSFGRMLREKFYIKRHEGQHSWPTIAISKNQRLKIISKYTCSESDCKYYWKKGRLMIAREHLPLLANPSFQTAVDF